MKNQVILLIFALFLFINISLISATDLLIKTTGFPNYVWVALIFFVLICTILIIYIASRKGELLDDDDEEDEE